MREKAKSIIGVLLRILCALLLIAIIFTIICKTVPLFFPIKTEETLERPEDPPSGETIKVASSPIPEPVQIHLDVEDNGDGTFTLSWNGFSSPLCLLSITAGKNTETAEMLPGGAGEYRTNRLVPGREYHCFLTAMNQTGVPLGEADAVLLPPVTPVYATVWTAKETAIFDAEGNVKGKAMPCRMYCVLGEDEDGGLFRVLLDASEEGYISSSACFINLPDYLGDYCSYQITNGSCSVFTIHEYGIPGVSGTVIKGYENVLQADGNYLVPLLYPVARRLETAAKAALEKGVRLKIYDAFRPREATVSVYDRAEMILDSGVPDVTFSGRPLDISMTGMRYRDFMERSPWSLSSFLARGGSYHNLGCALDLTLEDAMTGEELEAQTSMHDLSWYSVIARNNEVANLLKMIMEGAGFGNIGSELWHYQDNGTIHTCGIPWLEKGVSAEGWMMTENGPRYRNANGTYTQQMNYVN